MISLELGAASAWNGEADVVFTHPYAQLPSCLFGKPMIVNFYEAHGSRQRLGERWVNAPLTQIRRWGAGLSNTVYVANLPMRTIELGDLVEDYTATDEPKAGWFPLELPLRLLRLYADLIVPPMTIWDGFCGRATVGRACQMLGLSYVGIDCNANRVRIAREYLSLQPEGIR